MNQGGLKHAATESRLDSKRERRRGAAGRATVLRRAPSDSDCSGETASLSADSGDRSVRPPPPPTRSGKTRSSRRRGSEWEVLEGLKDGQRFEKRPDVFNGYLHKKRKWPLKGWHKRYFVVDGGILVYARSPTDVARGRLHGSVDVGLSVISAKARRRRIDIDADEFIYHLRAKTPDVFRTWLNVLKAHRLYRQHLLTFGARESVPKIHPPLEDLPPTDTSSRTSITKLTSASTSYEDIRKPNMSVCIPPQEILSNIDNTKCVQHLKIWLKTSTDDVSSETTWNSYKNLCSMDFLPNGEVFKVHHSPNMSKGSTNEEQVHSSNLDLNSLYLASPLKIQSNCNNDDSRNAKINKKNSDRHSILLNTNFEPTTAYFFFARKRFSHSSYFRDSPMRRSNKSTNLVKYRNVRQEPKLKRPLSKCMLLGKHQLSAYNEKYKSKGVVCEPLPKENDEIQVILDKKEVIHTSLQDTMTTSEYDGITERLMIYMLKARSKCFIDTDEIKQCINEVVKELYNVKFNQNDVHPVKLLFNCLLEFWLKNTDSVIFKDATKSVKSVETQNLYFNADKNLSGFHIFKETKETQFHGVSEVIDYKPCKTPPNMYKRIGKPPTSNIKNETIIPLVYGPKRDTESFEKERKIQMLERLLKSTVYACETSQNTQSKERDIKITKTLIDNLEKLSKKSEMNKPIEDETSNSSTELPKIQETINHLISETSMSPDVAKEFLNAYLGVLLDDSNKSLIKTSSQSSEHTQFSKLEPECEVQTEAVIKKISKSIITKEINDLKEENETAGSKTIIKEPTNESIDPGQLYLKDILDKITTIFSKVNTDCWQNRNNTKPTENKTESMKDELGRCVKDYPGKNLIKENYDENSVVIDLSKYDLENISLSSDPSVKGNISIIIKLKEKPLNYGESKKAHLNLKFSNEVKPLQPSLLHHVTGHTTNSIFDASNPNFKSPVIDYSSNKKKNDSKTFLSDNESTSNRYCDVVHESEHSLDLSFNSSNFYKRYLKPNCTDGNDDPKACFLLSFKKNTTLASTRQPKKRVRLKECNGLVLNSYVNSTSQLPPCYPEELTIFERPAPKIIDEKFILLLLENLTLLSKDIPVLYKEINSLYLKLKKKQEKLIRNGSNIQGVSLLGKIYNDDINKANEVGTQYLVDEIINNSATNTSHIVYSHVDRSVSAYAMKNDTQDSDLLVLQTNTDLVDIHSDHKETTAINVIGSQTISTCSFESLLSKEVIATPEQLISSANSCNQVATKDRAISTMIKYVSTKPDIHQNSPMTASNAADTVNLKLDNEKLKKSKKDRKHSPNLKQDLIKEIKLLSPSFKVSMQSQTDRNAGKTNCYVYQLYLEQEPALSRSKSIASELKEWSKDLKSLYRCTSQPFYHSD